MNFMGNEFEATVLRNVRPGDVVILKFKGHLSRDVTEKISEHFAGLFPDGVKACVFGDGEPADVFVYCRDCPHWEGRHQSVLETT